MKTLDKFKVTRRQVLKAGLYGGAGLMLPWRFRMPTALAATQGPGLSDPAMQPKFTNLVPNALDPSFIYDTSKGKIKVAVGQTVQDTGLVAPDGKTPVPTTVWGYGDGKTYTWPGRTFVAQINIPTEVKWENRLGGLPYLITGKDNTSPGTNYGDYTGLPVYDLNLHWAYSLPGFEYDITQQGNPIVPHVHGHHSDFEFDGNPEFYFGANYKARGPQWVEKKYIYDNSQLGAGTLWYHDHALGLTRLNVYAGMAGFYIVRDGFDTGLPGNDLDLPTHPYEAAFAIQDRMFKDNGELFYPAFPGDPAYADFITGENAMLPEADFPGGGPTALAEFFGDHMVVNGVIWPKMDVEPRNYRLRLLNGCDSRFLAVQFFEVPADATDFSTVIQQLDFTVIGSDQGLASSPTTVDTLLMETGSRYDIVIDFGTVGAGKRVIMKNIGGDEPFGGSIPGTQVFGETDRIMAFDVVLPLDNAVPDVTPTGINFGPEVPAPYSPSRSPYRKVALFEGTDEFGRLQPLLGTAEPATDYLDNPIDWPDLPVYSNVGLVGQMEGSIAWHSPTTENPALDSTEEWEIWNMTGDAHPVHLHLVHFEIMGRQEINYDSAANEDGFLPLDITANLAAALTGAAETAVLVDAIPPNTPPFGTIVVVNDNSDEIEIGYTSWSGNTFTLDMTYDFSVFNASATPGEENVVYLPVPANDDGVYLARQPTVQHNSVAGNPATYGKGFRIVHPSTPGDAYGSQVPQPPNYVENAPKDMVTALPGQITRIKATFDKPGRYVWHCHILSHEDHEMMRVLHVGPGA